MRSFVLVSQTNNLKVVARYPEWGVMGALFGWTLHRWWASLGPAPADPEILTWTMWIACVVVPAMAVAWSFLPKRKPKERQRQ